MTGQTVVNRRATHLAWKHSKAISNFLSCDLFIYLSEPELNKAVPSVQWCIGPQLLILQKNTGDCLVNARSSLIRYLQEQLTFTPPSQSSCILLTYAPYPDRCISSFCMVMSSYKIECFGEKKRGEKKNPLVCVTFDWSEVYFGARKVPSQNMIKFKKKFKNDRSCFRVSRIL